MKNYPNDTTELLEIPELVVEEIENKEQEVIFYCQCVEESECPHCKSQKLGHYKGKEKIIRHLPIFGKSCYLVFRHKSYQCKKCGLYFIKPLSFLSVSKHHLDRSGLIRLTQMVHY